MLIRMHAIVMASALGVLLSALSQLPTPTPTVRTAAQQQLEDRLDSFERDAASMRTDLMLCRVHA